MTQLASPEAVKAPFDDITLESHGRTYRLTRRGDEFFATFVKPEWESWLRDAKKFDLSQLTPQQLDRNTVTRKVVLTTGSHHMQGFWVPSEYGNQLQQLPWYYLLDEQHWVPCEDIFLQPPDHPRRFMVWNSTCLRCHSVGGDPGFDRQKGAMFSRVAEFGIACEACHGPGAEHVRYHQNPHDKSSKNVAGAAMFHPAKANSRKAAEACAQCHSNSEFRDESSFLLNGVPFRPGGELEKSLHVVRFEDDMHQAMRRDGLFVFWGDGTCAVAGDEYNGMEASTCFQRGELTCVSCHSMHDSDRDRQLRRDAVGQDACLQCHTQMRDRVAEHTHHAPDSNGSLCYNCHMPYTTYGLLGSRRSHRINSPSVAMSTVQRRPNACNLCHLDKTLEWTAEHLGSWYGQPRVELSEAERSTAASLLWLFRGNALERVTTAWHMGWTPARDASGTGWQIPFLIETLSDSYSAVRFVAYRSLKSMHGFEGWKFGFVGKPESRQTAIEEAKQTWKAQSRADDQAAKGRPLLNEDQIQRLREQRDETIVRVPE